MSMTPWNGNITQSLKWLQNNAPNIQAIINAKAQWYQRNNADFWTQWQASVYNLRTANPFGLIVWCAILGVPSNLFGLQGLGNNWAFGSNRQNFVWDKTRNPNLQNPNTVGGNFYGGGNTTLTSLNEVRFALLLRYASLVGNGRIEYINRALKNVFSPTAAWDYPNNKYAYVADCTYAAGTGTTPATAPAPFQLNYVFGRGFNFSSQFYNLLRATQYGILPQCAGSSIIVTVV